MQDDNTGFDPQFVRNMIESALRLGLLFILLLLAYDIIKPFINPIIWGAIIAMAQALAASLAGLGVPVFSGREGFTNSHQFAALAVPYGGGQAASKTLRRAGFLACGIGLPVADVPGDLNGLRIGTPELVRWGMTSGDADRLAGLIQRGLAGEAVAGEVAEWRAAFDALHFVHG